MRKRKPTSGNQEAKVLSVEEIRIKLENYCAYRERCEQEVRQKMQQLQIPLEEQEACLQYLKDNAFLNEERFAQAFTRGKFRIKHWGRNKILAELRLKNIKDTRIRQSLHQIDEGDYFLSLLQLLEKKMKVLKEQEPYKKQQKLFTYAFQKGYETELIKEAMKTLKI